MTLKEDMYKFDTRYTKNDAFIDITNDSSVIAEPLVPQNSIDIEHEGLVIKAKGHDMNGIIELVKVLYSKGECATDPIESHFEMLLRDEVVKTPNRRIAEINNPDREKPLDIHVDLLKDKVRLPRMAEGFRCPSCGQGFITKAVSSNGTQQMFIFRNANVNTGEQKANIGKVNIEGINVENRENKEELITLYKGLSELTFESVNLLYQEGTNCHCPICNEEHTLKDWIDAFTSPLNYFDREMICDICGDDAKLVMTDSTQYTECENNCLSKTVNKEKITEDKCPNIEDCNDTCCDSYVDESCDDCCGNKE